MSGYVNEIPDFTRPFDLIQIMTIIKAHCLFAHYPTLSIQGHRLYLSSDLLDVVKWGGLGSCVVQLLCAIRYYFSSVSALSS